MDVDEQAAAEQDRRMPRGSLDLPRPPLSASARPVQPERHLPDQVRLPLSS